MKLSEFHWGSPTRDRILSRSISFLDIAEAISDGAVAVSPTDRARLRIGYVAAGSDEGLVFTFSSDRPLRCEASGSGIECDLVFEADTTSVIEAVLQMPVDTEFPGRFVIDDRGAGGRWRGAIPPLDLNSVDALKELPFIAGASVVTQLALTDSPIGCIVYRMGFDQGRLEGVTLGVSTDADVMGILRFEDYLRIRSGEIFIADALEFGDLGGHLGKAQLFSGLTQSLEFRDGYEAAFTSNRLLSDYSRITRHLAYRQMVQGLQDRFAPLISRQVER